MVFRTAEIMTVRADLKRHPCFARCSARTRRRLEHHGTSVAVAPGTVVHPESPSRWVYFVLSGAVSVDDGPRVSLVGSGGIVALGAAYDAPVPRITVEAVVTTVLFVIAARDLREIANGDPQLGAACASHLARQVSA